MVDKEEYKMKLKTLQWNIGGGKTRDITSDPTKDVGSVISSYTIDGLDSIISKIKEFDVDIITLQETHANSNIIQAKVIADKLGFKYWVNDKYNDSHLEKGQDLCLSVISKFPISAHSFELFKNPLFENKAENGDIWVSHDKGYTFSEITLPDDKILKILTLHTVPFHRFGVQYNDPRSIELFNNISGLLIPKIAGQALIQGDFNIDDQSLRTYFPELLGVLDEVYTRMPTTPKGNKFDHVLYKNMQYVKNEIYNDVLTDHYPLVTEFEIK